VFDDDGRMTDDTLLPFDLPAVRRKKLTVDFEGGNQPMAVHCCCGRRSVMSVCAGGSRGRYRTAAIPTISSTRWSRW
jgi:hypothetical protein